MNESSPPRPRHPGLRAQRATLVGIAVNLLLALVKGAAGVLGHSYALIADAMESTLDVFSSIVVLSGLRVATRPPDAGHPYGHGKAEPLAAIVVSLGLIGAAIFLAIQSVHKIVYHADAPAPFTLLVLVLVIAVKETLYRGMKRVGRELGSTAVTTDAWHHRSDAITSAAAFIGISIAVIGGPGYEAADGWAALFACTLIAFNGWRLLQPALDEVMDAAPDPQLEASVRRLAADVSGVLHVEACSIRKMGFEYFVDLHVEVKETMTVREGHEVAHRVKDAIRAVLPQVQDVLIHIEPEGDAARKRLSPRERCSPLSPWER